MTSWHDTIVWQVAAGDPNRNYAGLCLKWGVILNGPGSVGPWLECETTLRDWLSREWITKRKISDIRRFAKDVQDGHLVILRVGTGEVYGVGRVVGDYEWNAYLGDVDGWDLQHTRRVRWVWQAGPKPRKFDTYTLKLGDTTQRIEPPDKLASWLDTLGLDQPLGDLPALPKLGWDRAATLEVAPEKVGEFLFDAGVSASSIGELTDRVRELVRLARWYKDTGPPAEAETVAFLVVPILRALGWPPQRMAVEWGRIDVALFDRLPRDDETLVVAIEAKKLGLSCLTAKLQAQDYAEKPGRDACRRLVVTDGIRYGLFERDENGRFPERMSAYLNLAAMKREYPIYDCAGAAKALLLLSAGWHRGM